MSRLDPPIDVIRSALFGAIEEATSVEVLPSASIAAEETVELPMPDSLKSAIAQALAADRAYANLPPETGQVRILRAIPGGRVMARPLGVLLDRKETRSAQLWTGWIVSPDADYAGDTDLVLDEGDAPFDPIASMVQAWNPVRAMIARSAPVAAVLSQEKMSVVYILSGEAK